MNIQAVLFDKTKWTRNKAKEWLKTHDYNSISNRTKETYYRFRIIEPRPTPKGYGLWNKDKKIWKSYNTTKSKVQAQMRLSNYIDHKK